MYPPNHYHTMTDDQLAQWHQLTMKCDRLERDLTESRKATESVQAAAEVERSKLRAEAAERSEFIAQLALKEQSAREGNRRTAGQLVQTQEALRVLLTVLLDSKMEAFRFFWPGEVFRAISDCEEVLRAHGIPF